ncbi:hypothetical protein GCM10027299_21600 [Larkinella ripae]
MKRIFVLLLFLSACQTDNSQEQVKTVKKAYDFRKMNWGDKIADVKKTELKAPDLEDTLRIVYKDINVGLNKVMLLYFFKKGRAFMGVYDFSERHLNDNKYIEDFYSLKEDLTKKYGKPTLDTTAWSGSLFRDNPNQFGTAVATGYLRYNTRWKKPNTEVALELKGDNLKAKLYITYIDSLMAANYRGSVADGL